MRRKANGVLLLSGILLISGQGVFAADANLQQRLSERSGVRSDYSDGNKRKAANHREKKSVIVAQEVAQDSGFLDIAMRFSEREMPTPNLEQERSVNEGAGSWLAMLVAGLGVGLVSIIRRIRNIR